MEDTRNAKRLAYALENGTDSADRRMIARILNYDPDQLNADIESLIRVLEGRAEE